MAFGQCYRFAGCTKLMMDVIRIAALPKMQANNVGVRKDRFPDKNLDCRTPTASDWKTNRTRSPVGTANTLMHQHYNDLQSSSSGLAVWVIFFAKDPRVTPSIIRTASVFFQRTWCSQKTR